METDSKRKLIMTACLIFIEIVLIVNIAVLINTAISNELSTIQGGRIANSSFTVIALVVAILYISAGFKKASAKYFKFFLYVFILAELIKLFTLILIVQSSIFIVIGILIAFILLNVLFGTKDLGKKKSLILSTLILVCFVFSTIASICLDTYFDIKLLAVCLADISLALVLLVMMVLKYYDKTLRNTK